MRLIRLLVPLLMMLATSVWADADYEVRQTWKIASLEWPPYASSEMPDGGDAVARLRELLAPQGIELQVEYMPWAQAKEVARGEDYVGYFPAWPSELAAGFVASRATAYSHLALITTRRTQVTHHDLMQLLERYNIGIVSSYTYPDRVDRLLKEYASRVTGAPSEKQLAKLLDEGQVDIVLTAPEVFKNVAHKQGLKDVRVLSQFVDLPLVLALRDQPDNAPQRQLLNTLLSTSPLAAPGYQKPATLFGTYLNIPANKPFVALIKAAYAEMGIQVKLEPVPAQRGLILLDAGFTDLDVARVTQNAARYDNIEVVEPSLAVGEFVLVCAQHVPCNLDVLDDPSNTIFTTQGAREAMEQFSIQARVVENENLHTTLELLRKRNVKYAIHGTSSPFVSQIAEEFQVLPLRQFNVSHVINKKHAALIPELQKALKRLKLTRLQDQTQAGVR